MSTVLISNCPYDLHDNSLFPNRSRPRAHTYPPSAQHHIPKTRKNSPLPIIQCHLRPLNQQSPMETQRILINLDIPTLRIADQHPILPDPISPSPIYFGNAGRTHGTTVRREVKLLHGLMCVRQILLAPVGAERCHRSGIPVGGRVGRAGWRGRHGYLPGVLGCLFGESLLLRRGWHLAHCLTFVLTVEGSREDVARISAFLSVEGRRKSRGC
jgi:hypothetical protein